MIYTADGATMPEKALIFMGMHDSLSINQTWWNARDSLQH